MIQCDLLTPGSHRVAHLVDDAALVAALVEVERAWLVALQAAGFAEPGDADRLAAAVEGWEPDLDPVAVEGAGTPVLAVVKALRARVDDEAFAARIHRGLTSQDVLDTAVMSLATGVLTWVDADLTTAAGGLAEMASAHRSTIMAGRTLTQHAVPTTFGLKAAQWLHQLLDARESVRSAREQAPVQLGGAGGTRALLAELDVDPSVVTAAFADELGLAAAQPWHTRRTVITRLGDALVETCDALGPIAATLSVLGRPEIAEAREASGPDTGRSSTMPHKRNPVLTVLLRSAAIQAPHLGAALHAAASQMVDERPDGAWHAEWPPLRRLLLLTATAASQAADLLRGLIVDESVMAERVRDTAMDLTAERGGRGDPADYLGDALAQVDHALARWESTGA